MIKTQIVKEKNKPVVVIMDYREYSRLKGIEQDRSDYNSALKVKQTNKKWFKHGDIKKEFGF